MIEYEPKVIYEFADKLNSQIKSTVICNFLIGLFAGILIFGGISAMLAIGYDFLIMAIGAITGAAFGISAGRNRVAEMKIQAQLALCQAKIEENTRNK
jgi:hypothetical protein